MMPGLFGPTVAEIQQSISDRGRAQDLEAVGAIPQGRGPQLAAAGFGRNLGSALFGQPNNPELEKAKGLQEVEQLVRKAVEENNIRDPAKILDISKTMLLQRGFLQEALMVHQKSVEANKQALETRRLAAEATRSETAADIGEQTKEAQIASANLAPDVTQQQLEASKQQQATSKATQSLRQVQTEKARFEMQQLKKAAENPMAGFENFQKTLTGFPEKVKLLMIAEKAKTDLSFKQMIGGDVGLDTLETIVQGMTKEDTQSFSDFKLALIRKKFYGEGGEWTEQDEAAWNAVKRAETLMEMILSGNLSGLIKLPGAAAGSPGNPTFIP